MASRISGTPPAIALIKQLTEKFGPIIFFQSGGCCEGSGPMCMPANEFKKTPSDVKVGEVEGAAFYMGHSHFQFSRGRLFTDEELKDLPPVEIG